ncbi:hypothetical protein [Nonomuraea sp. NPDC005650]|uniref:hypothetical protein n=1 Tax=Nonomuraea sp. NPDC005650 TaxID=3157045 RepID=UPI0033BCC95B
MPGNILIVAKADGSLVRVPIDHPEQASKVRLSTNLKALTAGIWVLPTGSIVAISSGLLSGKASVVQRVRPGRHWKSATVSITATAADPSAAPSRSAPEARPTRSGGLATLLAGKPNDGFTLRPVNVR